MLDLVVVGERVLWMVGKFDRASSRPEGVRNRFVRPRVAIMRWFSAGGSFSVAAVRRVSTMVPDRDVYVDVRGSRTIRRRRSRPGRREAYGHVVATFTTRARAPGMDCDVDALDPSVPRCLHRADRVLNSPGLRARSL